MAESGNFTEDQKIWCLAQWLEFRNFRESQKIQTLAYYYWPETFYLDLKALDKLVPVVVTRREKSWRYCMGRPMKQPEEWPGTCAICASIVWVEALHRFQYLEPVGPGKEFPYTLVLDKAFSELLEACRVDGIWMPCKGAYVGSVLDMIQQIGGVLATT
ncbi:unnamed protein product, partial [Urochloa humidicola]